MSQMEKPCKLKRQRRLNSKLYINIQILEQKFMERRLKKTSFG